MLGGGRLAGLLAARDAALEDRALAVEAAQLGAQTVAARSAQRRSRKAARKRRDAVASCLETRDAEVGAAHVGAVAAEADFEASAPVAAADELRRVELDREGELLRSHVVLGVGDEAHLGALVGRDLAVQLVVEGRTVALAAGRDADDRPVVVVRGDEYLRSERRSARNDMLVPHSQAEALAGAMRAANPAAHVDVQRLEDGDEPWTHAGVSKAASDDFEGRVKRLVEPFGRAREVEQAEQGARPSPLSLPDLWLARFASSCRSANPHAGARPLVCRAMTGELSFFELGVEDPDRGRAFYEALFGWEFEPGPTGKGFVIGAPNIRGGMHGGDAGANPYVFFAVDDIDAAIERVRQLGGEVEEADVEGDKESVARFGRFKLCRDDQGSPFGLHQPPSG